MAFGNNVNLPGFVMATDYYSWDNGLRSKYGNYIIFDISTDEIIAQNHSFGFSKRAKEALEEDELVIAEEFISVNSSLSTINNSLNNLIHDIEQSEYVIVRQFQAIDTSLNSLIDSVNNNNTDVLNMITDLSTNIYRELEDDELVISAALNVLNTSISNLESIMNTSILNSLTELVNHVSIMDTSVVNLDISVNTISNDLYELEEVLIHYLDKSDASIHLLETYSETYDSSIQEIFNMLQIINTSVNTLEQN